MSIKTWIERDAELERLRVQLSGCGVAAMQNTEASKAHRAKKGDYGWSESYGDVCRAVDREIELRVELERVKIGRDNWKNSATQAISNIKSTNNVNTVLRAELAAIKGQQPVAGFILSKADNATRFTFASTLPALLEYEAEGFKTEPLFLAAGAQHESSEQQLVNAFAKSESIETIYAVDYGDNAYVVVVTTANKFNQAGAQAKPLTDDEIYEATGIYPTMNPTAAADAVEIARAVESAIVAIKGRSK